MIDIMDSEWILTFDNVSLINEWVLSRTIYTSGLPPISSIEGQGGLQVKVYDAEGNVEYMRSFTFDEYNPKPSDQASVSPLTKIWRFHIPSKPDVSKWEISHKITGRIYFEKFFNSEKAPIAALLASPQGLVTESFLIRWEGSDPENKELKYELFYSHNNGLSSNRSSHPWSRIGSYMMTGNQYELNPEVLRGTAPGQIGKLRLMVTNGTEFSLVESTEPFTVPIKPPIIEVTGEFLPITASLEYSASGLGDSIITLRGVNGKHIADDKISWYSSKDGFLSRGRSHFESNQFNLTEGVHDIYVQVEDQAGNTHKKAIKTITVIDNPLKVTLRQGGDGSKNDLACNEIELNAESPKAEIAIFDYGIYPQNKGAEVEGETSTLDTLPIKYILTEKTVVSFGAKDVLKNFDRQWKVLFPIECVSPRP